MFELKTVWIVCKNRIRLELLRQFWMILWDTILWIKLPKIQFKFEIPKLKIAAMQTKFNYSPFNSSVNSKNTN